MSSVELPYRFETGSGPAVLVLESGLNNVPWSDIERLGSDVLSHLQTTRPRALVVDLSGMNYMGSAMVALVVRVWKAMKEIGGEMVVVNRHADTLEVLRVAGLTKVWTIVASRDEALARLRGSRGAAGSWEGEANRWPLATLVAALLFMAAELVALAVALSDSGLFESTLAVVAACMAGAVALVTGTVAGVLGRGTLRIAAVLVVLVSLSAMVLGLVKLAGMEAFGRRVPAIEAVAPAGE